MESINYLGPERTSLCRVSGPLLKSHIRIGEFRSLGNNGAGNEKLTFRMHDFSDNASGEFDLGVRTGLSAKIIPVFRSASLIKTAAHFFLPPEFVIKTNPGEFKRWDRIPKSRKCPANYSTTNTGYREPGGRIGVMIKLNWVT